jgi:hypothetical protein
MRQGGLMVPQPRIDAADRIKAERIFGQGLLNLAQNLRRLGIAAQQAEQFGQLRAIFAARIKRHGLLHLRQSWARAPAPPPPRPE